MSADRDALAAHIKSLLEGAELNGQSVDEFQAFLLIIEGQALLIRADLCSESRRLRELTAPK